MQMRVLQSVKNKYVSRIRQFGCQKPQIAAVWPELAGHIKAAIKVLIATHDMERP